MLWSPAHKGRSSLQAHYAQPTQLISAPEQNPHSFTKEKYCLNLPVNSKFKHETMHPSLSHAWLHVSGCGLGSLCILKLFFFEMLSFKTYKEKWPWGNHLQRITEALYKQVSIIHSGHTLDKVI